MLSAAAILMSTAAIRAQQPDPMPAGDGIANAAACARLGFNWEAAGDLANPARLAAVPPPAALLALVRPDEALAGGIARLPLRAGPGYVDRERYPGAPANPVRQVITDPVSTFSIDVDKAGYSNVRRFLNDNNLPPSDAVRIEELINYFDYAYAAPESADAPFAVTVAVTPSPWAEGREIIHIGLQGYEITAEEEPSLNLVFLVDVSGSMWSADKLPLAQEALNILVDQLGPQDHVSIVVYAGAAGAVLEPTAGDQKLMIRCAIGSLRAGGSTAGGAGMALAYSLAEQNFDENAVNRVVLLTDGDFNVGITNENTLEDFVSGKRDTDIYLSVYGFGRGNYNDLLMQTLSQAGNGTAAYIDTLQEARRLFRDDFSSSFFPIADDVKIQIEFNPTRIAEYRLIGYETRLLNQADFNNDQVDAGEVSSGASVTALYEVTFVDGPLAIGPLRYQAPALVDNEDISNELAFLSIRYKMPGDDISELIVRAISDDDRVETAAKAPEATRWALSVAAFGQLLRGDPYIEPGFGWEEIIELAQSAVGQDPFEIRAEFVQMVRAAATARLLNE
jgi:Ca-activated chloride channel family protein